MHFQGNPDDRVYDRAFPGGEGEGLQENFRGAFQVAEHLIHLLGILVVKRPESLPSRQVALDDFMGQDKGLLVHLLDGLGFDFSEKVIIGRRYFETPEKKRKGLGVPLQLDFQDQGRPFQQHQDFRLIRCSVGNLLIEIGRIAPTLQLFVAETGEQAAFNEIRVLVQAALGKNRSLLEITCEPGGKAGENDIYPPVVFGGSGSAQKVRKSLFVKKIDAELRCKKLEVFFDIDGRPACFPDSRDGQEQPFDTGGPHTLVSVGQLDEKLKPLLRLRADQDASFQAPDRLGSIAPFGQESALLIEEADDLLGPPRCVILLGKGNVDAAAEDGNDVGPQLGLLIGQLEDKPREGEYFRAEKVPPDEPGKQHDQALVVHAAFVGPGDEACHQALVPGNRMQHALDRTVEAFGVSGLQLKPGRNLVQLRIKVSGHLPRAFHEERGSSCIILVLDTIFHVVEDNGRVVRQARARDFPERGPSHVELGDEIRIGGELEVELAPLLGPGCGDLPLHELDEAFDVSGFRGPVG